MMNPFFGPTGERLGMLSWSGSWAGGKSERGNEFVKGGYDLPVQFEDRLAYREAAKQHHLREGAMQIAAVRSGIASIIPAQVRMALAFIRCGAWGVGRCGGKGCGAVGVNESCRGFIVCGGGCRVWWCTIYE